MYLGEAIAKGGINAKLYRKEYGELPLCYAGHQFVTLENAIVIASRVDLDTGMGFDSHTF